MIRQYFNINERFAALDAEVMNTIAPRFAAIEAIEQQNQWKMLNAFTSARVALTHLAGSTGYGYDDAGREKLGEVFASLCGAEAALFRAGFASGTHALTTALFGILRPGNAMLCASGTPYDTLHDAIGLNGSKGQGSLADFGVTYKQLELKNGEPDTGAIAQHAPDAKMLYLQRSRGYASRPALTLEGIAAAAKAAKAANPNICVVVDNCYGEFTSTTEPTHHGADLIVGSLIKNPGGGIAPTGGYIAGQADLVELCAQRHTAPGVGAEVGSASGEVLRQLYLGLYFAPGVTAAAMKTGAYASALFEALGCPVSPHWGTSQNDIITSIETGSPEKLVALCGAIQAASPVDSFLRPEPWPMPGYNCDVIMAAGAFTQGSSIELSCDAPMRPPYTAYLQGGLNFASARAGVLLAAQAAFGNT